MTFCVALTGSVASGKTTASELFQDLGIEIINADKIARELTTQNQLAYSEILAHFGPEILDEHQEINRKKLRTLIFSDSKQRTWLEQLLHPLIRKKIAEAVKLCTTPYCLVEIPLLTDKKNYPYIHRTLLIDAPKETQIKRVMQRDHCTKEQALAILAAHPDQSIRIKNADDLLLNNLDLSELKTKVYELHKKYLRYSKQLSS